MFISRLLSASLLIAVFAAPSTAAFSQSIPVDDSNSSPSAESGQPATSAQNFLDWSLQPHVDKNNFFEGLQTDQFKPPLKFQIPFNPKAKTAGESLAGLCYSMRSYVVARDAKDSDSVHPVKYSTCQPAARYQVRTTELRAVLPEQ